MKSKEILVIDDSLSLCESMSELLSAHGHNVTCVTKAVEAYILFEDIKRFPDIVICDWDLGLGQPNGGQVISRLRKSKPNVRYMIYSGLTRPVADGVEFFLKDGLLELLKAIDE